MTSYEMQKKISAKPAYTEGAKKFKSLAERRETFETSKNKFEDVKAKEDKKDKEANNG